MSKDDVPGEKRTTSPDLAVARARSTASASDVASSDLTAPSQSRAIRSAISPIKIGRLGVVDVIDPADLPDEFAPVRSRLVCAKGRDHFLKREPAGVSGGESGHQILDVVRAAQLRLIQSKHRFVFKNDRAFGQAKVGAISV